MFREWKAKLNETFPASSLQARTNLSLFRGGGIRISSDLYKLFLREKKDDATRELAVPKPDPDAQKHNVNAAQEHEITRFKEISPPPCTLLGPKYVLWDYPRPVMGSDWYQKFHDLCNDYRVVVASNEGYLGRPSVVNMCR
ncbi:hypothetical protein CQW23_23723 [Capsicum baccatum]|uniref:Uncharacterized protein n=1 Tax=Capsicum baccatum TaxID=33114 RepID=A0A2G2VSU7_CAPBA|nr:hypothetical protein CQW23_23723 [Capsicum baccatum]